MQEGSRHFWNWNYLQPEEVAVRWCGGKDDNYTGGTVGDGGDGGSTINYDGGIGAGGAEEVEDLV